MKLCDVEGGGKFHDQRLALTFIEASQWAFLQVPLSLVNSEKEQVTFCDMNVAANKQAQKRLVAKESMVSEQ